MSDKKRTGNTPRQTWESGLMIEGWEYRRTEVEEGEKRREQYWMWHSKQAGKCCHSHCYHSFAIISFSSCESVWLGFIFLGTINISQYIFFKQRLCCLLLVYLKIRCKKGSRCACFQNWKSQKSIKDFTLAYIQEGNSNISDGNNLQNPDNT